jgi:hypothetical protein
MSINECQHSVKSQKSGCLSFWTLKTSIRKVWATRITEEHLLDLNVSSNNTGNVRINGILRHVWVTFVVVENTKYYIFWVCVCSRSYPGCNAHASFCHLWPVPPYNIFQHYLINGMIFEKRYWTQNVCYDFIYSFCLKHFSFWAEWSEIWSKMYLALHIK